MQIDFEGLVEQFCEGYCKHPDTIRSQEELDEKCEQCPIVKLVERLRV